MFVYVVKLVNKLACLSVGNDVKENKGRIGKETKLDGFTFL